MPNMTVGTSAPRRGMVRNVVHLGLGQVATTALTILSSAAVARTLGASDFGLLYLLTSIATFAYVVVDWGHGPYIIREVAKSPGRAGELLGSAILLRTVMAFAACGVAVVSTWLLGYEPRTRLLAGANIVALLPMYLGLSFGWVFRGYERMDRDAQLNVVQKVAALIVVILCLALGGRVTGLTLSAAIAGLVTCALAVMMYRRLDLPTIRSTRSTSHELLRDGAPMLAMSLAVAVEPYFNANILFKMGSSQVVGWYGAAWNIAGTLVAPAMILGATMYPRLSSTAGTPSEFKRALRTSFRPLLVVAVVGAIGTYLFADVAVGLIYGQRKFGPAADNLRAFASVLLLMYIDLFFSHAILAAGRAGSLASAKVAVVGVTIALEFFLVPFSEARFGNGGLGVMYAMSLGELAMLAAAVWLIRDSIDRYMAGDVCRGLLAGGATILIMQQATLPPFVAIPGCVLLFLGLSAVIGLVNRSDMDVLIAGLRKRPASLETVLESRNLT
jgi:O-antigen/teichoic acid export membrane protein